MLFIVTMRDVLQYKAILVHLGIPHSKNSYRIKISELICIANVELNFQFSILKVNLEQTRSKLLNLSSNRTCFD